MENQTQKVVTRFAPSPTGRFHVGGVRSALYNFIFARQNNGVYILRSEDTDKARSKKEYEDEFLNLFDWLGLKHDLFFRQSDRLEIHQKYLEKMISDGYAYISKETPTEEGQRTEVIRFKNPNKKITFSDLILGEITFDTTDLGDFVIARDMNEPLYHLTVVIDDFEMGVTHVIRGQEHTPNTPRQILIQEAIGAPRPIYAHLPLILNSERAKLSKRDETVMPAAEYKNAGYLPGAILNFMALNGWNPGGEQEIFTLDELTKIFDISKVQKGGGVFNPEKLDWVNKEHIKLLPESDLEKYVFEWLPKELQIKKIIPIITERISKFGDIKTMVESGELDFFYKEPVYEKEKLIYKNTDKEIIINNLKSALEIISKTNDEEFNKENIKIFLMEFADSLENRGQILHPVRFALSGLDKSPDPFILADILGKTETITRINKAISVLSQEM